MSQVHCMRWSCPHYAEEGMDPEQIYDTICPDFDTESLCCSLGEPWFDCDEYQRQYGVDDFKEE